MAIPGTKAKRHLGDAVHADFDRFVLILTTENGEETTNIIYLEPEVWQELKRYMRRTGVKGEV